MAAGSYAQIRASATDLDRSIEVLKTSFVAGRLTKDELDQRVGQVFSAHSFAELMAITADLPAGPFGRLPAHPASPRLPRASSPQAVALGVAWLALMIFVVVAMLTR